ncbi:MAG: hypothetical protein ABJN39_20235 [Sulfitobacter sp.]|uniref:hypothetical protein n=1 Tax=Sulfitobacter sp. TaxID=1903071 RepID=UPI00329690A8
MAYKTLLQPLASRVASGIAAFLVTYGVENSSAETIAAGAVAAALVGVDLFFDSRAKRKG